LGFRGDAVKKQLILRFAVLPVVALTCSCVQGQAIFGQSGTQNTEKVLYSENFNNYKDGTLPPDWWVEGGQSVYVENGHLRVNADPKLTKGPGYVATVWLNKEFSGDIQIQFDAHVISSTIDTNNINFFLYFNDPEKGRTLSGTRNLRLDGLYDHYFSLNGYIFTFLRPPHAKTDLARFRLHRCPGFELMAQKFASHSRPGETYQITITKRGRELTFSVDGTEYLRASDDKYNWTRGFIGFRTFQTDLWFDNLLVKRLK
jgi:hypothetical protein